MTNEAPNNPATDEKIGQTIFALLKQRDVSASICPSEVARALASSDLAWRALMPAVRRVAATLAAKGALRVTRGADEVDATSAGGPVRLRRPKQGALDNVRTSPRAVDESAQTGSDGV